jgi:hypothetical protein
MEEATAGRCRLRILKASRVGAGAHFLSDHRSHGSRLVQL